MKGIKREGEKGRGIRKSEWDNACTRLLNERRCTGRVWKLICTGWTIATGGLYAWTRVLFFCQKGRNGWNLFKKKKRVLKLIDRSKIARASNITDLSRLSKKYNGSNKLLYLSSSIDHGNKLKREREKKKLKIVKRSTTIAIKKLLFTISTG